jgi:acetyl/propionyl-CoA carboxylase alpha subunit
VATNHGFHRRLLADPAFQEGDIDIQFLDRRADLIQPTLSADDLTRLAVAAALAEDASRRSRLPIASSDGAGSDAWAREARLEGLR